MATNKTTTHRMAALFTLAFSLAAGTAHADELVAGTADADELAVGKPAQRKARKHHLRMAGELATVFAIGNRWYWRDGGSANVVDWQLPDGAAAIDAKLTSAGAWRFDGNPYDINAPCHPGFGMLTHFLARQNGYGIGESFLISTVSSGIWEVFFELREYGSLNDLVLTSPAGVPLGEAAYQIFHHFHETRFELQTGLGTENGASFALLGASGDLDRIPTTGNGWFRAGRHVSFDVAVPTDDQGPRSYSGGVKTTVAGHYWNRDNRHLVAALSAEFDYKNQADRPEREWDLFTTMAVGPSIDYRMQHNGLTLDAGTDLYLDFGMLKAQAFETWRADNTQVTMRNVMSEREHPYYYGIGSSITPRVAVGFRNFFAGAKLSGTLFRSIDSADRDQETLTSNVHFTDIDTAAQASAGFRRGGLSLVATGGIHHRAGTAGSVHDSTSERVAMLTVGLSH